MIYPINYLPVYHPSANAGIWRNRRNLKKLKKRLGMDKIKVLDVGCGLSYFLFDSATHIKGLEGFGLDINEETIDFVKKISEKNRLGIEFKTGNAEKIPFEDDTFHLVVCNHVLEHAKKPEKVIMECRRVLKRGGELWLGFPSMKDNPVPVFSSMFGLELEPEDHVIKGFEKKQMASMAKKIGFNVVEQVYEFQLLGKIISDMSGILGELGKISMKRTSRIEPYYSKSLYANAVFDLKVLFSKMLAFVYRFDFVLKGFRGKCIISRWIKT